MASPGTISSTSAVEVSIHAVAPASTGGCSGSGAAVVVWSPITIEIPRMTSSAAAGRMTWFRLAAWAPNMSVSSPSSFGPLGAVPERNGISEWRQSTN